MSVCANGQQTAPPTRFALDTSALRIPFELSSNVIFLQVRVNNSQPLWFVLDTGAQLTIIDAERAKLSGIKFSIVGKAEGAGGSPVDAGLAKDVSFSLPGLDFQARQTGIISLSELNRYIGRTVDGILGHNFFSRFVVEIDYAARSINLYDPKSFQYSGAGESVPIELKDSGANVRARLALAGRAPIEGDFRIDTGGSHALLLHTPFVKAQSILQSIPKTIAVPAAGVGGETNVLLGRIQSFCLSLTFAGAFRVGCFGGRRLKSGVGLQVGRVL
jgi:Aspartyl protease